MLGNIASGIRNKPNAKVLLDYLPQLKAKTTLQKKSKSYRLAKCTLYQYALNILTRPLLNYRDRFDLQTDDDELWYFSFISVMLGDLPENIAITLMFNSTNCKYPCHECLVEGDELNNVELSDDQIILRTSNTMKAYVDQGLAQQYSLYNMVNVFWRYP